MVITISQPELYQGASHKTRMHQHTDGKTFVNIIMGQCFLDISTPLLLDSSTVTLYGFVGGTFNVFSFAVSWREMCIYLFCNFRLQI